MQNKINPYLVVIGTRPEAIKLAPLCIEMKKRKLNTKFYLLGNMRKWQMRFSLFDLKANFLLNTMQRNQSLSELSSKLFFEIEKIFKKISFNVFVQGDTSSSYIAGITSFYNNTPVYHVEAGLRTNNLRSPFPGNLTEKVSHISQNIIFVPQKIQKITY